MFDWAQLCLGGVISYSRNQKIRKLWLFFALFSNLSILFYFKYFNFAIHICNSFFGMEIGAKDIVLPIGISFYTFQGLTYVIDVYRGDGEVLKNPMKLGLYIAMFPQLIAGPIVRFKDVAAQLDRRIHSVDKCFYGIWRFVCGLAKKAVIANTVAETADRIFSQPACEISVSTAWLGIICYAFQIYFDFSGYSDMAIGLGKILGFDFAENFNYPYVSLSITEFWRRWHISLSSFFRDYVYIPLGGSRTGNVYINLFVVFLLTGLWHGASFNFIIWGLWHGSFIILERINKNKHFLQVKNSVVIPYIYTMSIVLTGWVFFRTDTVTQALQYIGRMINLYPSSKIGFTTGWYLDRYLAFILLIAAIVAFGGTKKLVFYIKKNMDASTLLFGQSAVLILMLFVCMVYVMTASYNPFIYFRF